MTTTIHLSVDVPHSYNVAQLKLQLLEYAQRIVAMSSSPQQTETHDLPRKIEISPRIHSLSGRYPVPTDFDYKELLASELESNYNVQQEWWRSL